MTCPYRDGMHDPAILDPEPRRAPGIVAIDVVDTLTEQLGDQQAAMVGQVAAAAAVPAAATAARPAETHRRQAALRREA